MAPRAERGAASAHRLRFGGDPKCHGSAGGRQSESLVRRQGTADTDSGDPGQGALMTGRYLRIAGAAFLALVGCGSQAWSQDASTLKKDMVGQWELSTTERSKTCVAPRQRDAR